ncbi:flagellar basal body rod protein FlgB [Hydrogenimonas cancrithermarum]|uniref:Flagellar basal body rod protein FlgB n=1 Tax=Hydrogenimonas cancrithermarum TaxID=2993563 RepID=A0ABN6WYS6_9BACT|nr:flagellar basal body rod protein FlgB [Hydrogenimonas cancrithermarum]BDY13312.1 flagellar basal body rod protein FlgB [Hydrogenimonas cancrithermarum]
MEINRAHTLMAKALDYRALRQDLISSNIANVDTPFYRSRDIAFEDALAIERDRLYARPSAKLELAATHANHLNGTTEDASAHAEIFFRDGHTARNDGNTVDLDVETTEMAKNTVMYNALVAALKKNGAIFRSVIDASAKV